MDNWENYRLILALHRSGTVRGAAQMLDVNHGTVSRRLAQINTRSTHSIFEKVTGGYQVTEYGLEFIQAGEQMEDIVLTAERKSRAISANLSGPVRISMGEPIAQFLLKDELLEFAHAHPNIDLEIETSLNMADLDRSEADIVIRGTATPPEHLVGRRLFPFYLSDYCARDYLETTPFEGRKWLRFSRSLMTIDWVKETSHPDAPVILKSDDLTFLLQAVAAGRGMLRTACYMADAHPELMRLPGASRIKAQDLWVLTHPDLKSAKRIQYLMKYLCSALEGKRDLIQGIRYAV